ncbi:MAG: cytochrome c [Roseomonas sp.]|nr:cytochrome c [Roseomonas sp.]
MKFLQSTVILASFIAMTAPALAQGDVIAARRDGMKGSGRLLEGVKTVLDQRGDPRTSSAGIAELIVFFEGFPARFPAGSGAGDTRALPAIWSDRAGFESANANMLSQLRGLQAAAGSGDQAAFAGAFQQTAASCDACHRAYRGRAR